MRLSISRRAIANHQYLEVPIVDGDGAPPGQLRTDGGEKRDERDGHETDEEPAVDRSSVEVTEAGETEPADPKWEKPDPEDIPEFEMGGHETVAVGGGPNDVDAEPRAEDPTTGMPNTARSPGQSRIKEEGTEGYVVALELCARLPEDIRLPEDAADLVPAAVEAELEDDIQAFAAAEFDNPSPHVDTLAFVEADDGIWLRLRLGVPAEAFVDFDPDEVRAHALQQLDGLF